MIEQLKLARDRVERGWCQGSYGCYDSDSGEVCAVAALGWAGLKLGERYVTPAAMAHLARFLPGEYENIPHFNDAESTTKADVLGLFDKALADLGGLG